MHNSDGVIGAELADEAVEIAEAARAFSPTVLPKGPVLISQSVQQTPSLGLNYADVFSLFGFDEALIFAFQGDNQGTAIN